MRLSAPTKIVFLITVVLAAVAIVGHFVTIPVVSGLAFWILAAAYGLLALSTLLKGL